MWAAISELRLINSPQGLLAKSSSGFLNWLFEWCHIGIIPDHGGLINAFNPISNLYFRDLFQRGVLSEWLSLPYHAEKHHDKSQQLLTYRQNEEMFNGSLGVTLTVYHYTPIQASNENMSINFSKWYVSVTAANKLCGGAHLKINVRNHRSEWSMAARGGRV